jgi:hypothetical protein
MFAWGLCCGCILKLTGSLLAVELSCCDCPEIKVSRGNVPFPHRDSNPCLSVALMAQFLILRQRKLCTIIIQTLHNILQHDGADTGSLPMEDFSNHNPNYFHITQPGSSIPLHLRTNAVPHFYFPPPPPPILNLFFEYFFGVLFLFFSYKSNLAGPYNIPSAFLTFFILLSLIGRFTTNLSGILRCQGSIVFFNPVLSNFSASRSFFSSFFFQHSYW